MVTYFSKYFFDGSKLNNDVYFSVANGRISKITSIAEPNAIVLDGIVTPGFIDTQVNGGGGLLLNNNPTLEAIERMSQAHRRYGTTSMLPTLITDDIDVMHKAADSVAEAIERSIPGIAGIHFEGPHLSVSKRGIHSEKHIRNITDNELSILTRKDIGKVLVTIAPENVPPDIIQELVEKGVLVSIGHSNATSEVVLNAIDAGATGATHLFNAMSGLTARDPGVIGAVLFDNRVSVGLIADLHHVDMLNCQLAYKVKSPTNIMLVTDAMAHVGSSLTTIPWQGSTISLQESKLCLPNGALAGSCLNMFDAVKNLVEIVGIPLVDVLISATSVPSRFIGKEDIGNLHEGAVADFLVIDCKESISLRSIHSAQLGHIEIS